MKEMSMTARVGRLLYERWKSSPDAALEARANGPHPEWDAISPRRRAQWAEEARAIFLEMREPTIEMIVACSDLPGSQQECWTRSIDAALDEAH